MKMRVIKEDIDIPIGSIVTVKSMYDNVLDVEYGRNLYRIKRDKLQAVKDDVIGMPRGEINGR